MGLFIHSSQLPGGNNAREFEGKDYGAGLTLILVDVETGHGPNLHRHPYEEIFVVRAGTGRFFVDVSEVQGKAGDIVVAPAGTAHRFINSGTDRLQLTAIHHNAGFVTERLARRPYGSAGERLRLRRRFGGAAGGSARV